MYNMYLTIITGSNNMTLRKVNVRPRGYNKMCIYKDLIEDNLYQLLDQFNERKINHIHFYFTLLNNIHPL